MKSAAVLEAGGNSGSNLTQEAIWDGVHRSSPYGKPVVLGLLCDLKSCFERNALKPDTWLVARISWREAVGFLALSEWGSHGPTEEKKRNMF